MVYCYTMATGESTEHRYLNERAIPGQVYYTVVGRCTKPMVSWKYQEPYAQMGLPPSTRRRQP